MKGYLDGELGMISIDSEVIARYAGSTAVTASQEESKLILMKIIRLQ